MNARILKPALLATLLCSACSVGPRYQTPVVAQTPVAFKELKGNDDWKMATPSDDLLKGKWWEIFGDAQLNRLEEMVDINNQNVKQAEAQFRQARAVVVADHANYYPTIGATPAITQSDSGPAVRGGSGVFNAGACTQTFRFPSAPVGSPISGDAYGCRSRMLPQSPRPTQLLLKTCASPPRLCWPPIIS